MPHINFRYTIIRPLGDNPEGGVYLAEDRAAGNARIALKLIGANGIDAPQMSQLRSEFFILSRFTHPHIARVFDFGKIHATDIPGCEGRFFFTLEYIEGKNLFDFAGAAGPACLPELVFQLAHALAYIHRHGLIHFDIKPSNIIVAGGHRAAPVAKIIDFGFASDAGVRSVQPLRGTLGYIAPELLKGDAYDERADLYSLGAALYETAAREPAFGGVAATEIIKQQLSSPVPAVREKCPHLPLPLAALITELLHKDPVARPRSAASIAERMCAAFDIDKERHAMLLRVPVHMMSGRGKEAAHLSTFMDEALAGNIPAGRLPVCFIAGETGIGKSTLLQELRRRMQSEGATVFHTQCFAHNSEPYEPFIKLLRDQIAYARSFGPRGDELLRRHDDVVSAACAAEGDGLAIARQTTTAEQRLHFADRWADLFFDLASIAPYGVIVDDIDNADESSLELFRYVLRSAHGHAIGFLASAHSEAGIIPGVQPAEPSADVLRLGPLDEEGVAELMRIVLELPEIPAALARTVARTIGGSPYILKEFLAQFIGTAHSDVLASVARDIGRPAESFAVTIARLYEQKLSLRKPEELMLMRIISCFDAPVRLALLQRVSPFSPPRLKRLLDVLSNIGVIRPMQNGSRYHFTDPQFRAFVHHGMKEGREILHALIAQAIVTDPAYGPQSAEAAAHHFKEAGDTRSAYASYCEAAEHKRAHFAINEAIALLNEARMLVPASEADPAVTEHLAQAYSLAGDYKNAARLYEQLSADAGCDAKRYTYAKELGLIHNREGRLEEAIACLTDAAARARTDEETLDVEEELVIIDMSRGRYAEAHERCTRVLEAHPAAAGSVAITGILNNLGIIHFYQSRADESAACFRRSIDILQNEGQKSKLIGPYLNLGNVHSAQGKFAEASAYWQHALLLSQEVGNLQQEARAYNNIGIAAFNQGNIDEASRHYEKAYSIFARLGFAPGMALCLTNIGEVHCANAEYERAIECWEKDLQLYRSLQDEHGVTEIVLQLAGVHLLFGDADTVQKLLDEARRLLGGHGIPTQHGLMHQLQGSLELFGGNAAAAREELERARTLFGETKEHRGYCLSSLRLAEAEHALENDECIWTTLEEVLRTADEHGLALLKAEALYLLGSFQDRMPAKGREPSLVLYLRAFKAIQSQPVTEITWRVCHRLGEEYLRRGLQAKAFPYLTYAEQSLRYIAGLISSIPLRERYFGSWRRGEMLDAIRERLREGRTM